MRLTMLFATASLAATSAFGQTAISAKSGLIHYAEGDVLVGGKAADTRVGYFSTVKNGETLATTEGRAEMLAGPGVFVRIGENSQIKMINAELTDTRLELLAGSLNVEASESVKENKLTIIAGDRTIRSTKDGVFSVSLTGDTMVKVWDGEVSVEADGKTAVLKAGRQMAADASALVSKFETDSTDELYRWAKRRGSIIALANVSGARMSGTGYSGVGQPIGSWYWNNYFNTFTYVPGRGIWRSPFGYAFYSPGAAWAFYNNFLFAGWGGQTAGGGYGRGSDIMAPTYNRNLGYNTVESRSTGGYSMPSGGGGYSAGGGAAAAPAAASPRSEGGGAVGHSGGGRGN